MKGLVLNPPAQAEDNRPVKRWGRTDTGTLLHNRFSQDIPTEPGAWVEIGEDVRMGDVFENGAWWPPEKTAAGVRARRDAELVQADRLIWPYLDRGETPPQNLADYKQALRDVPEQQGFPTDIIWPQRP